MLAKKFRLSIRDLTARKLKRVSGKTENKFFIIKTAPNYLLFSRFGVAVNRKVSNKAVRRNWIKRTIFDFIRLNNLHQLPGKDVLIIILAPAIELTKAEIGKELKRLLIVE